MIGVTNAKYSNNCYWNLNGKITPPPLDAGAVVEDPCFVAEIARDDWGDVADGVDPATFFSLSPASPCINAGKVIADNGGRDYAGNPLYDMSVSIGAFEIK